MTSEEEEKLEVAYSKFSQAVGDALWQLTHKDSETLTEEWKQAFNSVPAKKLQKLKEDGTTQNRGKGKNAG